MALESPEVPLEPSDRKAGDVTVFWRVPRYQGLACLRATFRRHAYARHTHDTYAIAAILDGCETFFHRGVQHYAGVGSLAVVGPDEVHDGEPHGGLFEYRTLYPSVALMQEITADLIGRPVHRPPFFPHSVIADPDLPRLLVALHASLRQPSPATLLEQDSRFVHFLATLIARHADLNGALPESGPNRAIARAREHLDAHFAEEVDLAQLAAVAGLSRTHLIRRFQREIGLTPHAYLLDRRFREASRRLGHGEPPGDVAVACGFFDQSHLNRVFKARMGVTPGAFRSA
jgi:AraC-like DNA-binding protein